MSSQFEKEEQYLEDQLANGEIDIKEFNREMQELQRDYRAAAQEAAEQAYHDEIERW